MINYNENYVVHKYNGEVYSVTLKELFRSFNAYTFLKQFGYGTDFGKYLSNFVIYSRGEFCFSPPDSTMRVYYKYLFYITTNTGKLLQPEQVLSEYCKKYDPKNYWYLGYRPRIYTGYKRRRYGNILRHMKTTAERRAVHGVVKEDGEPEFRGNRRNLPHLREDYWRGYNRSWKSQSKRKHQYKGS